MSKLIPLLTLILFALASRPPSPVSSPSALATGQLISTHATPNGSALIVSYRLDAGNATLDLTYVTPDGTQTTDVIAIPPNPARVIVLPCNQHLTITANYNTGPETSPINLYQLTPPPGFSFPCLPITPTYLPIISAP